jgi:hypothetical protein
VRLAGARRSFSSSPELHRPPPRLARLFTSAPLVPFRPDRTATTHVPRGSRALAASAELTWQAVRTTTLSTRVRDRDVLQRRSDVL